MSNSHGSISRFPLPQLNTLPGDIRERIEVVQEKSGFVPNVFVALAHRPAEFRAFFDYYDALMLKDGALSKAEREMIVVATSASNNCLYCVVSHGALLRIYSKQPMLAEQIALNWREAPISARQKAMLEFAMKVAGDSHRVGDADYERLRDGHRLRRRRYLGYWCDPPRFSRCPTAWRICSPCNPTRSFTPWVGRSR